MKKLMIIINVCFLLIACAPQEVYLEHQDIVNDINDAFEVLNNYFPYNQAVIERTGKTLEHHKMMCLDTLNQEMNRLSYRSGYQLMDQCLSNIGVGKLEVLSTLKSIEHVPYAEDILSDKKVLKAYDTLNQEQQKVPSSYDNIEIISKKETVIKIKEINNEYIEKDLVIINELLERMQEGTIILDFSETSGNDLRYIEEVILDQFYVGNFDVSYLGKIKEKSTELLDNREVIYTPVYNSYCKKLDAGAEGCIIVDDHYQSKNEIEYLVDVRYSKNTSGIVLNLVENEGVKSTYIDDEVSYHSPIVSMQYFKLPATGFIIGFDIAHPFNQNNRLTEENGNK